MNATAVTEIAGAVAMLAMPAAVFAFEFWQGMVRPRLIPRREIEAGAGAYDFAPLEGENVFSRCCEAKRANP